VWFLNKGYEMGNALQFLAVSALPIFLTLTMPVALQAWLANRMGDNTPKRDGRLSWDPINHMDLLGTVIVPALFVLMIGAGAGFPLFIAWAKPLELDLRCYPTKTRLFLIESTRFVAPLLMALCWLLLGGLLEIAGYFDAATLSDSFLKGTVNTGVYIGVMFFAVATLPFPPFPLGNLILRNLPEKYFFKLIPYLQYSSYLIMFLAYTGVLSPYLYSMMSLARSFLAILTFWL
jgi:hypothetical protein